MLTPEEEKFLKFWGENRNKVQTGIRQYRVGLSIGLVFGIGIIINLTSGWYSRANMVANSQSTPIVLLTGILIISIFCSYFYRQFRREANEQRYKELIFKKEKEIAAAGVQQNDYENGQIGKS
jgi:hypothetical protein